MKVRWPATWALTLVAPLILNSQDIPLFSGLRFNQSLEEVNLAVKDSAASTACIEIEQPAFPMAENKETHLIALGYEIGGYRLDEVVFTFADDRLVFVQAKGNVVDALEANLRDSVKSYIHFEVYPAKGIFFDRAEDSAWFLGEEGLHLNLFLWDHPLLPSNGGTMPEYHNRFEIPSYLGMGRPIAVLLEGLEEASDFTYTEKLDGSDPYAQLQLNCFGAEYGGFPRKMEARFGDGKLNMVWVLTGKGEEERMRSGLRSIYGNPVYMTNEWEIFHDWQVCLRKDKPEILIVTPELGKFYKKEYFGQD